VSVVNSDKSCPGLVEAIADLDFFYPGRLQNAFFSGLIAVTPSGGTPIMPGDSGSLLVSAANEPVRLVMAASDDAFTTDTPPKHLGQIVAACDLGKVINELTGTVGASLTQVRNTTNSCLTLSSRNRPRSLEIESFPNRRWTDRR
jgi:hypothetical protein